MSAIVRIPVEKKGERAFPPDIKGKVEFLRHESDVLEGNPLGDPSDRDLVIYLPRSGKTEGKPLLILLAGFTGYGGSYFPQRNRFLMESFDRQMERLVRNDECGEAVVVAPDCMTSLGGSQYLNSSATGRYEDYVVREIVPWVKERFGTGETGILGHSSGGFGSLMLAMRHPATFQGTLASAPDAQFEYCYMPEFPRAVRMLKESGGPERFLEQMFTHPPAGMAPTSGFGATLDVLAMASCYSPAASGPGAFELPFDWETGEIDPSVWKRWLAWDPVRSVDMEEGRSSLHHMKAILLGAGKSDEWNLDVAAHRFAIRAREVNPEVQEAYFPGGHFDTWPLVLDRFLPRLVRSLSVR